MRAASATSSRSSDSLAPGQLEDGVEPGPDPPVLGALLAGALELVDLASTAGAHGVGQVAPPRAWPGSRRARPRRRRSSSPSSLRMASSWRRSRNSRWVFSMPSSTSVLIRSRRVRSARVSRAQPSTSRSRSLDVDGLEHLHLLRRALRSGEYPDMSAIRPGSVTSAQPLGHRPAPLREQDVLQHGPVLAGQLDHVRRLAGSSTTGRPGPTGPGRCRARRCPGGPARSPRTATAGSPPGSSPRSTILATTPDRGIAAVDEGARARAGRRPPPAASAAALASSVSRARVKTIPGAPLPRSGAAGADSGRSRPSVLRCLHRPALSVARQSFNRKCEHLFPWPSAPPPRSRRAAGDARHRSCMCLLSAATLVRPGGPSVHREEHQMFVLRSWQVRRTFTSDRYGLIGACDTTATTCAPPWWRPADDRDGNAEYG